MPRPPTYPRPRPRQGVPPWLLDLLGVVLMLVGLIATGWLLFAFDTRLGCAFLAAGAARAGIAIATRGPADAEVG